MSTNPLSRDHSILRPNLIGSLLDVVGTNLRHGIEDVAVFEIGKGYGQDRRRAAGVVAAGLRAGGGGRAARPGTARRAPTTSMTPRACSSSSPTAWTSGDRPTAPRRARRCSTLVGRLASDVGDRLHALLGQLHPSTVDAWELRTALPVIVAEVAIAGLAEGRLVPERAPSVGRHPEVDRDLAIVVPEATPAADVETAIRARGGTLLRDARLFDIYRGCRWRRPRRASPSGSGSAPGIARSPRPRSREPSARSSMGWARSAGACGPDPRPTAGAVTPRSPDPRGPLPGPFGRCYPSAEFGPERAGLPSPRACVNLADTLTQINVFDVVVVLYLFGWFILGFIQGTIRRLLGIAALVFSFFLALQLNAIWLGSFLSTNWTQYPKEYSVMIGYLVIFVAAVVAFTLVIQGTYKKAPLFHKYPVVDEIVGGLLGIVQGFLLLLFVTIILDQYFLYTNIPPAEGEIGFLRTFWDALNTSNTGNILHGTVIPAFLTLFGLFIPTAVHDGLRVAVTAGPGRAPSSRPTPLVVGYGTPAVPARPSRCRHPRCGARARRRPPGPRRGRRRGAADRADRGGRGVRRRRRSRLARPHGPHRPQCRHVRAARASPTSTLSTACTTA